MGTKKGFIMNFGSTGFNILYREYIRDISPFRFACVAGPVTLLQFLIGNLNKHIYKFMWCMLSFTWTIDYVWGYRLILGSPKGEWVNSRHPIIKSVLTSVQFVVVHVRWRYKKTNKKHRYENDQKCIGELEAIIS